MGQYDFEYMRENFKVGFADTLGDPWWGAYGDVSDITYPGAIPLDDAKAFLGWKPEKVTLSAPDGSPLVKSWGKTPVGIVRPDTGALVGIMNENYPTTSYSERLLDGLSAILDDPDLSIGSVLMLDGGSVASVQIQMNGNLSAAADDTFRLWLAAYTSLDGSLKTTFKKGATRIECDNTFEAFAREGGSKYSYKNTPNSGLTVATAREALDIFTDMESALQLTVSQLVGTPFTEKQWATLLDVNPTTSLVHVIGPKKGTEKEGIGLTKAENRRMDLTGIYHHDDRVKNYVGTQWGAFQAFSTHNQHETSMKDTDNQLQRNARKMLSGDTDNFDAEVMRLIESVSATV